MFTYDSVAALVAVLVLGMQVVIFLYIQRANREAVSFRERVESSSEESLEGVKKEINHKIQELYVRTKRDQIDTYRQVVAAHDIESMVGSGITRNLRGWAISPDALISILNYVKEYKPKVILEIGSGYSTVALERLIKSQSLDTIVVTVDHDSEYLAQTKSLVGDTEAVRYVHAPLKDYKGEYSWYDINPINKALKSAKAELVVVDGPPETTNRYARRPVVDLLEGVLSKEYTIILDDAARSDEKVAVEDWLGRNSSLNHRYIYTEKGLSVLSSVKGVSAHKLL